MDKLNLPEYQFNIKTENNKSLIFDEIRKQFVSLTPEEWVRQNFLKYLINEKHYPQSLIAVEKQIVLNGLLKRCDAVVYNKLAEPKVIVEFKAPQIKISEKVFEQISRYNFKLKVDFLIVSNGLQHFCCKVDYENFKTAFLKDIPTFNELINL